MAAISENATGFDPSRVDIVGVGKRPLFKTGQTIKADDGALYQYVKANATIAGGNTAIAVTKSGDEYVAANSGGTGSNASGASVSSGQFFWVKLA